MTKEKIIRLWEEYIAHEVQTHDTEATLETMVPDAYVNHVPVMTGGYGREALRVSTRIPTMPPDTTITPVSRRVGEDQLADEMIFSFTHTQPVPWMLPGVAPVGRKVRGPIGRHRSLP
jgi:carboxymethylenebutenolidase